MPSLVATTSTPARKPFVRTHYVRTNNAKFSDHYIYPRTETVCAHALRSHQKNNAKFSGHYVYPRTETVRAHALRSHQYICECSDSNWTLCLELKLLNSLSQSGDMMS